MSDAYRLGGVGLVSGTTGKLGRAWVGAWHGAWVVVVVMWVDVVGVQKCLYLLPGLVRLDLIIGGGLDGDWEEVIGVVSGCEMGNIFVFLFNN